MGSLLRARTAPGLRPVSLLVRALIPDSLPQGDWRDVETARTNYAVLDTQGAPCRIPQMKIGV